MAEPKLWRRHSKGPWYAWIGGRRISTRCRDKAAARAAARELERQSVDPEYHSAHQTTLGDEIGSFLDWFAQRVSRGERSDGTLQMHRDKLSHVARIVGADTPLGYLRADLLESYFAQRTEEGAAPGTLNKERVSLSGMLKRARRLGRFDREPAAVIPPAFEGSQPRETWLTREQVIALLCELPAGRGTHLAFIVATGARRGESYRAQRADLDTEMWQILLRGTKTKGAWRTVPVPALFRGLLVWAIENAPGDEPLFRPWRNLYRDVRKACARAGLPYVTPNDLRRSFSTWLRAAGAELDHIAPLMGHADTRMLQRVYARMSPEQLGALIDSRIADSAETVQGADDQDPSTGNHSAEHRLVAPVVAGSIPVTHPRKTQKPAEDDPSRLSITSSEYPGVHSVQCRFSADLPAGLAAALAPVAPTPLAEALAATYRELMSGDQPATLARLREAAQRLAERVA